MSTLRTIRRTELCISQEELARRAGLHRDTISKAERKTGAINHSTAALIVKALNDLQAEYDMS